MSALPVPARMVASALAVLVLLGAASGCGRKGEFADRTARVTVDGTQVTFGLDTCGVDGTTVFVVGRTSAGRVLQAVVGVRKDGSTGVLGSTGLTLTDGPQATAPQPDLGAAGAESWSRRGESGRPPGRITSARVRGARIQAAGMLEPLDADGRPASSAADSVPFTFDARCDDQSTPA